MWDDVGSPCHSRRAAWLLQSPMWDHRRENSQKPNYYQLAIRGKLALQPLQPLSLPPQPTIPTADHSPVCNNHAARRSGQGDPTSPTSVAS